MNKKTKLKSIAFILFSAFLFFSNQAEATVGEDGSIWVQVNHPGFGNQNNVGIVALCPYQGYLFALTRNDVTGFELWKSPGIGWARVNVSGFTDNNNYYGWIKPGAAAPQYDTKYNAKQNLWGDMIVYTIDSTEYLYVVLSSGYQGALLYGSLGLEIWRFDGTTWQPIISPTVDSDELGNITAIADCANTDSAYTAQITDSSKNWTTNQWAECVLRVVGEFDGSQGTVAGTPGMRIFDIISNTNNTLTVKQNENAGVNEYTICAEHRIRRDTGRPDSVVPTIGNGDSYTIECGINEKGFGEIWNKSIVDFEILNGELYASIGLNYQAGARVWKTSNGVTWTPSSEYSFGLFHGYDPDGNPTDFCLVPGTENRNGEPVSSSVTKLGKSDVNGTLTLFTGGTGTSGCNGRGARVARLDGSTWNLIVDYFVDENDEGTNENGFGVSGEFQTSNFQAWSWAEYDNLLFVSVVRLKDGSRIMYTSSGSTSDGAWVYSVGGGATVTDGFGDVTNIGSNLYVFDSSLYAGTISNIGFNTGYTTNGADIWKGTGPGSWNRVTGDGFGDTSIAQFEAFTTFGGNLYVAGSNIIASAFKGEEEPGFAGAKIFRLVTGTSGDLDGDGTLDNEDNCPSVPNGVSEGTCVNCSDGAIGPSCNNDNQCPGGYCSMNQEDFDNDGAGDVCDDVIDNYPPSGNGCIDACDCEGDFDRDGDGDGSDAIKFKIDFGRKPPTNPCTAENLCNGDFDCDGNVDGSDAILFKRDFGRRDCPTCAGGEWCSY